MRQVRSSYAWYSRTSLVVQRTQAREGAGWKERWPVGETADTWWPSVVAAGLQSCGWSLLIGRLLTRRDLSRHLSLSFVLLQLEYPSSCLGVSRPRHCAQHAGNPKTVQKGMNEYTLCTLKRKNYVDEKQVIIYFGLKSTFFIQYPNQIVREAI